ncbi:MAG: hypothetical protein Q4E69_04490 [Bacilli bacterium]|nr:hypothetical protein [Bacilli bacterium]
MKRFRNKKFIIFILILFISIGFAYLSTTLNIAGLIGYKANSWNIYFDNVQMIINDVEGDRPTINNSKDTVNFNISFNEPSEVYRFSVDVVNSGTIDAMIGELIKTGIDSNNSDYIDYSISYSNGSNVEVNDLLSHGSKVRLVVNVEYKNSTERIAPTGTENYSLTVKYVQARDNARKVEELVESGNNNTFVLNNAKANTLSNLKIYGNTSQTQYSGKNLYNVFDYCLDVSCVTNGSIADEDGWITMSVDNSSGASIIYSNFFTNNLDLVVGDTYTIVVEIKSVSGTGGLSYSSVLEQGTSNGQLGNHSFNLDKVKAGDIVIVSDVAVESGKWGLRTYGFWPVNQSGSITFRLSVIKGTGVTKDNFVYEPYVGGIPSPNPNYPQDIHSVNTTNQVMISSIKNVFSTSNIRANYELAGGGGAERERSGWFVSDFLPVKSETNYQMLGKSGQYNCFYKSDKTFINCQQLTTGIITTPANAAYMKINDNMNNIKKIVIYEVSDFDLLEGNIYSTDNALLNYELLSGVASGKNGWFVSDYIDVEETSGYYLKNKTVGQQNAFYDANYNYISTVTKVSGLLESPVGAKYMRINGNTSELEDIQIIPVYSRKTINLDSIELYKINDYKDYIYNKDGEWYVHREIFKHTFTNFIALTSIDNNQRWCKSFTNLGIPKMKYNIYYSGDNITNSFSTHFLISKQYSCNLSNDNLFAFSEWSDDSYIYFSRNIGSIGTEAGNAILGSSIYYPLYEPYDEKITDTTLINQLNSLLNNNIFEGTNYITVTGNDLTPMIEFDYERE